MSCILNIETSTNVCSVAVSNDGECIFNTEDHEGPNHAVKLGEFVDEALSFIDSHAIPLDAVVPVRTQGFVLVFLWPKEFVTDVMRSSWLYPH